MKRVALTEIAAVIRSKNAGPYELTFDILFKDERHYLFLKEIDFFTPLLMGKLYGISTDKIIKVVYFDPAYAVKITIVRPVISGAPGETDVYGAQQHAPLLNLKVPVVSQ